MTTLYCFPHAGATAASYRHWTVESNSMVEVRPVALPRLTADPAPDALERALDRTIAALGLAGSDRPFALYGHSLGGIFGFAVALRLQERGDRSPALLGVGACRPPRSFAQYAARPATDEALVRLVRRNEPGGALMTSPVAVHPVVLRTIRRALPLARALGGLGSGSHMVSAPLLGLYGTHDTSCDTHEMAGWAESTSSRFSLQSHPGGHLFHQASKQTLCRLAQALGAGHWPLNGSGR